MSQNLSSAVVVIGALWVKSRLNKHWHEHEHELKFHESSYILGETVNIYLSPRFFKQEGPWALGCSPENDCL